MSAARATARLSLLALALPEAEEHLTWDEPNWRVRGRIFALQQRDGDRLAVWVKAPPGAQQVLVGADAERFFAPPYLGGRGWVGVRLHGRPDWEEIAALVRRSYRLVAPRRLGALVPE
jgi:predicted DNA-binding protein (MmcQ/YjbR family)